MPSGSWRPKGNMRLILRTAAVHTLDPRTPRAEAVLVENGRVAALGSHADADGWYRPGDDVVDRPDAVAIPGLVDAHLHLMGYALHLRQADLIGVRSIEQALDRIRLHAASLGPKLNASTPTQEAIELLEVASSRGNYDPCYVIK